MFDWTIDDQHAAYRQGWGIFAADGDPCNSRIERIDDPSSLEDIVGLGDLTFSEPLFDGDADANAFVIQRAARGDTLASKAIACIAAKSSAG